MSVKNVIERAADKVNSTDSAKHFADIVASLHGMPPNSFGDPKAAAEFGKEVAKGAARSQEIEAESAASNFEHAQATYRVLVGKAESEDERMRILDDIRQSEERADQAARHRIDSNERIWKTAIKGVVVVSVGVVGLTLAAAAYALSKK